MEDEIGLREILQVLWHGKYCILGVTILLTLAAILYTSFLVTPTYRYSAFLDLTSYGVDTEDVLALIEKKNLIVEVAEGLVDDPARLARTAVVNASSKSMLEIAVNYINPDASVNSVKNIGLAIIDSVFEYRLQQVNLEKTRTERLLCYIDETVEEYLPTSNVKATDLLEEDPVYKRLLEEKASCLVNLKVLNIDLAELAENQAADVDIWLKDQKEIAQPVTINKKRYIAAAALFGLMLSIAILFTQHYLTTHVASAKKIE